jgi:hypothetical protein
LLGDLVADGLRALGIIRTPRIFAGSKSSGINTQALSPSRAACAATAFARFPVEEQPIVSSPNLFAAAIAVDTTRSLNESVGKHTASFFT